jgi:TorA maturation chaperone TorD
MENRDMQQDAEARAKMYTFLSSVFLHPPTVPLVQQIRDQSLLTDLSALFSREAIQELEEFSAGAGVDADLASLRQEYMDLFAVPTGRYVTPFEDVYLGASVEGERERGPLLGEQAIAVRRLYRQAGVEMTRECRELPTHIGVELSFMGFLCEQEMEAVSRDNTGIVWADADAEPDGRGRYRDLQLRFLQNHLNVWFPHLRRAIQSKAKSRLYPGLALISEEFLARDAAGLLHHPLSAGDAPDRTVAGASE